MRIVRYSSRAYAHPIAQAIRELAEPLPQPRRRLRRRGDCDAPRPSIEQQDPLWSARYEVAAGTYKVTHSCLLNLLSRVTFTQPTYKVHDDVQPALRALYKTVGKGFPDEYIESAWDVRNIIEDEFDSVPIAVTLLDYIILKTGLTDLPNDEKSNDAGKECLKPALEEKMDEHGEWLLAAGIEVKDI